MQTLLSVLGAWRTTIFHCAYLCQFSDMTSHVHGSIMIVYALKSVKIPARPFAFYIVGCALVVASYKTY